MDKADSDLPPAKRGPRTKHTDEDLTNLIAAVLEASPFTGEAHRKVWARLRASGVRTSKPRVLRLMREANLLATSRQVRRLGPRNLIRTLKGQLLWVRTFETVEELRLALHEWIRICNERWLVERHARRSPAQVRRDLPAQPVAA